MDVLLSLLSRLLNALVTAKDPITVILAIVAIVYAAIQKHESSLLLRSSSELKGEADELERNTKAHAEEMQVQRRAMEGLTTEMRGIAASMSTKYIGDFPKNMEKSAKSFRSQTDAWISRSISSPTVTIPIPRVSNDTSTKSRTLPKEVRRLMFAYSFMPMKTQRRVELGNLAGRLVFRRR